MTFLKKIIFWSENLNPIPAGVLENQDMLGGVNLTPPAQGQLPQKYKSPYKKQLYIVKFTSDNLTVLLDPITGNVSYQNSKHLKLYKERKDIYKDLDPEFQQLRE